MLISFKLLTNQYINLHVSYLYFPIKVKKNSNNTSYINAGMIMLNKFLVTGLK